MLLVLLILAALGLVSCGEPPDILLEDVQAVWLGAKEVVALPKDDRLADVVRAYNAAEVRDWEGDTTPPLSVILDLADGTRLHFWFSGSFPPGCAQVGISPATGEDRTYRVEAPSLLPAVLHLAEGHVERSRLEEINGRPWLPR
jgi:hypothetical protein